MTKTRKLLGVLGLLVTVGCAENLGERLEAGQPVEQDEIDPTDSAESTNPAADEDPGDVQDATDGMGASDPSDATDATDPDDATDPSGTVGDEESLVSNVEQDDGTVLSVFDARQSDRWVYLDFDTGTEVVPEPSNPYAQWDIAFRRYKAKVNGGHHGEANVIVSLISDVTLQDVTDVPVSPWTTDLPDLEDDDDDFPEYALGDWFNYDPSTHILSPKEQVYVLRTSEGAFVKLVYVGYYDFSGQSGFPSIQWVMMESDAVEIEEPDIPAVGEPPFDED